MKIIHPSPTLVGDTVDRMGQSNNAGAALSEATCEGPSPHDRFGEWIRYGIALESKCLQALLSMDDDKSAERKPIPGKLDSKKTQDPDTAVQGSLSKKAGPKAASSSISSQDKENVTVHGRVEKLDIRLPFVDWKKIFTKATKDDDKNNNATVRIKETVSEIVRGWLLVLDKLGRKEARGFSRATSFRSQIYRRLTLLLTGFVATIACQDDGGDDKEEEEEAAKVVAKHTSNLARKILKEEGSHMKKKHGNEDSRRCLETDGIHYYCFFTAIAAECSEFLGNTDKALLAYKSIRAMEQRQNEDKDEANVGGVYSSNMPTTLCSSPKVTITKTPANTPTSIGRKGRRSSLFSPKGVAKGLRSNPANRGVPSKIGNDLVLPGTLEERILRCTLED